MGALRDLHVITGYYGTTKKAMSNSADPPIKRLIALTCGTNFSLSQMIQSRRTLAIRAL